MCMRHATAVGLGIDVNRKRIRLRFCHTAAATVHRVMAFRWRIRLRLPQSTPSRRCELRGTTLISHYGWCLTHEHSSVEGCRGEGEIDARVRGVARRNWDFCDIVGELSPNNSHLLSEVLPLRTDLAPRGGDFPRVHNHPDVGEEKPWCAVIEDERACPDANEARSAEGRRWQWCDPQVCALE